MKYTTDEVYTGRMIWYTYGNVMGISKQNYGINYKTRRYYPQKMYNDPEENSTGEAFLLKHPIKKKTYLRCIVVPRTK